MNDQNTERVFESLGKIEERTKALVFSVDEVKGSIGGVQRRADDLEDHLEEVSDRISTVEDWRKAIMDREERIIKYVRGGVWILVASFLTKVAEIVWGILTP